MWGCCLHSGALTLTRLLQVFLFPSNEVRRKQVPYLSILYWFCNFSSIRGDLNIMDLVRNDLDLAGREQYSGLHIPVGAPLTELWHDPPQVREPGLK